MRSSLALIGVLLSACDSEPSSAPSQDAAADTHLSSIDAAEDVAAAPPALTAFASPAPCRILRAGSMGFHTLCVSRGKPTTDFAGAPLPVGPEGASTLLFGDPDGKTKWATPTCTIKNGWGDIDGLPTGEAVLVATFDSSCQIGATTVSSVGKDDALVARFDPSGALQWMHRFGDDGYDDALSVRFDPLGNAVVAGHVDGMDPTSFPIATKPGAFVAKVSPTGEVVWTKTFTRSFGQRIGVGRDNAVYVLSILSEPEDFGGGLVPKMASGQTFVVVKYAADGAFVWQTPIAVTPTPGITKGTFPTGIAVTADSEGGAWFLIGHQGNDVAFGDVALTSPGKENALAIGHLDKDGKPLGGQVFEDRFSSISGELVAGTSGTAFFSSTYQGLPGYAFLAVLGRDAKPAWTAGLGDTTSTSGLAFDGTAIVVLGQFRRPLVLGSRTLTPQGSDDTFLARFAP